MKKIIIYNVEFEIDDEDYNYLRNYLYEKGYNNLISDEANGFVLQGGSGEVVYKVISTIVVGYSDVLIKKYANTPIESVFNKTLNKYVDLAAKANKHAEKGNYLIAISILSEILFSMTSFSKKCSGIKK